MNKIVFRDVWQDYLQSIKFNLSLLRFYIAEITINHCYDHNGYINENLELVCDYPITQNYIKLHVQDKYNSMTKPARALFFLLKGESDNTLVQDIRS